MASIASHSQETGTRRRIVVLGATGSIGTSCLDVVRKLGDRLEVVGMSAHSNGQKLAELAQEFRPRWMCVTCPKARAELTTSQTTPDTE